MSPDISICTLYREEPITVQTDLLSLNLVDFAFAPHYGTRRMSTTVQLLKEYSRDHNIVVYACEDSGGIVVDGEDLKCIGDVLRIDERSGQVGHMLSNGLPPIGQADTAGTSRFRPES